MSRFLKLTSCVINTAHINHIAHHIGGNNKYYTIYTSQLDLSGMFIFTIGWLHNNYNRFNICSVENAEDYRKIEKWIALENQTDFIVIDKPVDLETHL